MSLKYVPTLSGLHRTRLTPRRLAQTLSGWILMTPYLTFLGLILLPYVLGIHLLVIPGLFFLRHWGNRSLLGTLIWFTAASLPLSTLYVWAALAGFSTVALGAIAGLAVYTGLVAVIWRTLLERRGTREGKPLNKSLNSDAGKAGAG